MLTVRYAQNKAHFKNSKKTAVYYNNYAYGRDNINQTSTRYQCHNKTCLASITLSNDNHQFIDSGKNLHNHKPFTDCQIAIDINYTKIRESKAQRTSTTDCKTKFDQLLLTLQAEYSIDEVAMEWVKWDQFNSSLKTRAARNNKNKDEDEGTYIQISVINVKI